MEVLYQFGTNACSLAQEHKTEKLFYSTTEALLQYQDNTQQCLLQRSRKSEPCVYYTLAFATQIQLKDEDRPKIFSFYMDL